MSSQIVKIMRTNNSSPSFKTLKGAEKWIDGSIQIISSFREKNKDRYYTGLGNVGKNKPYDYALEIETKKFIFNELLEITYSVEKSIEFNALINKYYDTLNVSVMAVGLELEIGLENDLEPISNSNHPLNKREYIIYKAIFENNTEVANSKDEGSLVDYYRFYVHDVTNEDRNKRIQIEKSAIALSNYDGIKEKPVIVKTFISELGLKIGDSDDKNRIILFEFVSKNALLFEDAYADYKKEENNYINRLYLKVFVNYNLITETSRGGYMDVKSSENIANSKLEMLSYMRNPANAEPINGYKTEYKKKMNEKNLI
jgi:hypothetical protein